jgi:hypothetical protein
VLDLALFAHRRKVGAYASFLKNWPMYGAVRHGTKQNSLFVCKQTSKEVNTLKAVLGCAEKRCRSRSETDSGKESCERVTEMSKNGDVITGHWIRYVRLISCVFTESSPKFSPTTCILNVECKTDFFKSVKKNSAKFLQKIEIHCPV